MTKSNFRSWSHVEGDNLTQHIAKNGKLIQNSYKICNAELQKAWAVHNSKIIPEDIHAQLMTVLGGKYKISKALVCLWEMTLKELTQDAK